MIYGYVEHYNSKSCPLLLTDKMLGKFFVPYLQGWMTECSDLMTEILRRIKDRKAEALMEGGWKDYLQQYVWEHDLTEVYWVTQDNANYGQALINAHYSISWKKIKLTNLQIPEIFYDVHDDSY